MRPVVAKNRSSFGPQSIHSGIMTGIGKNRRGVSANSSGPVRTSKNCATVPPGIPIQNFPVQRVQFHPARLSCKATTGKSQNLESTERWCLLGAGGTGNVQEKAFGINSAEIA